MNRTLTVKTWREDEGYVSPRPEFDIASQADTVEEARANLQEAADLFFETDDASEVAARPKPETYVTSLGAGPGMPRKLSGREVCATPPGMVSPRCAGAGATW